MATDTVQITATTMAGGEAKIQLKPDLPLRDVRELVKEALGIPAGNEVVLIGDEGELPSDGLAMDAIPKDAQLTVVKRGLNPQRFKIKCRVRFETFDQPYPFIVWSEKNAFQLHGLGPGYGSEMEKITFYVNTASGEGPYHGRGIHGADGCLISAQKLTTGEWHDIVAEKGERFLSLTVDGQEVRQEVDGEVVSFNTKETGAVLPAGHLELPAQHVLDGAVEDYEVLKTTFDATDEAWPALGSPTKPPTKPQTKKTKVTVMRTRCEYPPSPHMEPGDVEQWYEATDTVASFKAKQAKKFSIPTEEIVLISKGDLQELEDGKTMGDYDFKDPDKPDQQQLVLWRINASPGEEFKMIYKFHKNINPITVKSSDLVADAKKKLPVERLEDSQGIPASADDLKFFFRGQELDDAKCLGDYQIGGLSFVYASCKHDPGELQTFLGKSVLMASFPSEFSSDGTYIQTQQNDTTFCP